jgi:hypothetical protein
MRLTSSQETSPPKKLLNAIYSTASTATAGSRRYLSSKHTALFNSLTRSHVAELWMPSKGRQCAAGRCVCYTILHPLLGIRLTMTDLEISKPQRNTKKIEPPNPTPRRRSRSPDYTRGGNGPTPRDNRYVGHPNSMSPRDRRFRDRDDYRPMRSPSPRAPPRGVRSRDRSRDRFDTRYRSRSRTPPRRHRSPSPRRDYTEDGLDLRRRLPHEVPDIQILVLNEGLPR